MFPLIPVLSPGKETPSLSMIKLAVPPPAELDPRWQDKVVDISNLHFLMDAVSPNLFWILIIGCFDDERLHPGHQALLTSMKREFGVPTAVAIENSHTIQNQKGGLFRPYASDERRLEKIARLPEVDAVALFTDTIQYGVPDTQSRRRVVRRMEEISPPSVLIDAADPYGPYPYSQNHLAATMGITRVIFERISPYSTTAVRGY